MKPTPTLGCPLAQQNKKKEELSLLRYSVDQRITLQIVADMERDPDLNSLKGLPAFADLMKYARERTVEQQKK